MSSSIALHPTAARSSSPLPPVAAKAAPSAPLQRRPKNRPPTVARFIVDELRGGAGFVSEDIWRDVFGFQKKAVVADRTLEDIDLNGTRRDASLSIARRRGS